MLQTYIYQNTREIVNSTVVRRVSKFKESSSSWGRPPVLGVGHSFRLVARITQMPLRDSGESRWLEKASKPAKPQSMNRTQFQASGDVRFNARDYREALFGRSRVVIVLLPHKAFLFIAAQVSVGRYGLRVRSLKSYKWESRGETPASKWHFWSDKIGRI